MEVLERHGAPAERLLLRHRASPSLPLALALPPPRRTEIDAPAFALRTGISCGKKEEIALARPTAPPDRPESSPLRIAGDLRPPPPPDLRPRVLYILVFCERRLLAAASSIFLLRSGKAIMMGRADRGPRPNSMGLPWARFWPKQGPQTMVKT